MSSTQKQPFIRQANTLAKCTKIVSPDASMPRGQVEALTNDGTVLVTFYSEDYSRSMSATWKAGAATPLEPGYQWLHMNDTGRRVGTSINNAGQVCAYANSPDSLPYNFLCFIELGSAPVSSPLFALV